MPNVTRKQLAERIAQSTGLTQVDTALVIETLLQAAELGLNVLLGRIKPPFDQ